MAHRPASLARPEDPSLAWVNDASRAERPNTARGAMLQQQVDDVKRHASRRRAEERAAADAAELQRLKTELRSDEARHSMRHAAVRAEMVSRRVSAAELQRDVERGHRQSQQEEHLMREIERTQRQIEQQRQRSEILESSASAASVSSRTGYTPVPGKKHRKYPPQPVFVTSQRPS